MWWFLRVMCHWNGNMRVRCMPTHPRGLRPGVCGNGVWRRWVWWRVRCVRRRVCLLVGDVRVCHLHPGSDSSGRRRTLRSVRNANGSGDVHRRVCLERVERGGVFESRNVQSRGDSSGYWRILRRMWGGNHRANLYVQLRMGRMDRDGVQPGRGMFSRGYRRSNGAMRPMWCCGADSNLHQCLRMGTTGTAEL